MQVWKYHEIHYFVQLIHTNKNQTKNFWGKKREKEVPFHSPDRKTGTRYWIPTLQYAGGENKKGFFLP
jgi:hypothetical protein